MDVFTSAAELIRHHRPERPVLGLRPHAASRAARWFLNNFPGRVLYAAKANDSRVVIDALVAAGITDFDVASLVASGILRRPKDGVRLLGDGEIKSKISITVNHATAKAKAAVEKAGGTVNIIAVKVLEADEKKRAKSMAKKAAASKKPGAKQDE